MSQINIKKGKSFTGDANLRYPNEEILNVKGFYDQNSHVMPENVNEYRKVFADKIEDSWLEYIPESYDGSNPVPLVFSRHGGGQSGWGQCYATSWNYIADREGLIVVYPDMKYDHKPGESHKEFGNRIEHEILFIDGLIEELKNRYNVDETRIYMQGMSMGNLMTTNYSRFSGNKLAGAGEAAGPCPIQGLWEENGSIKEYLCAVPVFQSRGENDDAAIDGGYDGKANRNDINRANKRFWLTANKCSQLPEISIRGDNNFEFYRGELADLIYRDVKNRGHGQTFDDAELVWSMLFSGTRRMPDGEIIKTEPRIKPEGDKNAAAFAANCSKAYIDNRPVQLSGEFYMVHEELKSDMFGCKDLGRFFYVPISVFEKLFHVAVKTVCGDSEKAEIITKDGKSIFVSNGNVGIVIDDTVSAMDRQEEYKNGELYLPIRWFAENIFNKYTTEYEDVLYISDHFGKMTRDMSVTIRDLLK